VCADQALEARRATTLAGAPVQLRVIDSGVRVNDARVISTDIDASNGVIHVIDAVLLPPEGMGARAAARDLVRLAISRGAPLFNDGQQEACAAIYEVTATALLQLGDVVPDGAQQQLRWALRAIRETHDMSDRSWTLRRALDETMEQLSARMES
jgi:hypothetical protein